ncbi:hypothetical protein ACLOJK_024848 [Asimina triloba]
MRREEHQVHAPDQRSSRGRPLITAWSVRRLQKIAEDLVVGVIILNDCQMTGLPLLGSQTRWEYEDTVHQRCQDWTWYANTETEHLGRGWLNHIRPSLQEYIGGNIQVVPASGVSPVEATNLSSFGGGSFPAIPASKEKESPTLTTPTSTDSQTTPANNTQTSDTGSGKWNLECFCQCH